MNCCSFLSSGGVEDEMKIQHRRFCAVSFVCCFSGPAQLGHHRRRRKSLKGREINALRVQSLFLQFFLSGTPFTEKMFVCGATSSMSSARTRARFWLLGCVFSYLRIF
mmetsp:Transcript_30934/g.82129  ORF Transcript_30934/g.82129 Transcript_30934/m.82129 type:complete len:108 (+) Transcript_30934:1764-2087(+)